MSRPWSACAALVLVLCSLVGLAHGDATPSAEQIVARILDADPWGLSGAEIVAVATIKDERGTTKQLRFAGRSRRYDGTFSKSILRVTAPADLAGVGLLQVQKKDGDDDRHLFLPELKRARRIAGGSRSGSFVGTDFAYGDLDRREVREAKAVLVGQEKLGSYDTYHLTLTPTGKDALYGRTEMWVRKDNMVPLKTLMYARSGALVKTLLSKEIQRISGRWFITRSLMVSENEHRSTELVLEKVNPSANISDDEFTVQNLERL